MMEQDFNPFDLSKVPPKPAEEAKPVEPQPVAPTVRRISMGPLFHSRITKVLAFVLGMVLFFLVGYSGTGYLLNKKAVTESTATQKTDSVTDPANPASGDQTTTDTSPSTSGSQDTPATTPSTPAQSSGPKIYCGVSGMPEGVCTAITSIEKDGLKGNPYVNADTSQVPDGSAVQVDESSWKSTGGESGTISFAANLGGKDYKGVATLGVVSGTWKVVTYVLQ